MTTTVSGSSITFNDNTTQNTSAYGGGFAMRNRIINGAMVIDQRNAGASVTPTAATAVYTVDRWFAYQEQASKFSVQQVSANANTSQGFTQSLRVTSLSAYTVGSAEVFQIQQRIEGYNAADLAWGTASASTVTLSFWVYSSLTGTFGGSIRNASADRSYPFSYTISSANTWTKATITVSGDTTGTWGTTNGVGIIISFGLGVGSTLSNTAGAWYAGNYVSSTGATSVVGTNGATLYITGVQLEKGSTATSFDYRPYGTELQLCQRYYLRYQLTASFPFVGRTLSDNRVQLNFPLRNQMRTSPSLISSGITSIDNIYFGTSRVSPNGTQTYSLSGHESVDVGGIQISGGGTYTDGQIAIAQISGSIAYSAEL